MSFTRCAVRRGCFSCAALQCTAGDLSDDLSLRNVRLPPAGLSAAHPLHEQTLPELPLLFPDVCAGDAGAGHQIAEGRLSQALPGLAARAPAGGVEGTCTDSRHAVHPGGRWHMQQDTACLHPALQVQRCLGFFDLLGLVQLGRDVPDLSCSRNLNCVNGRWPLSWLSSRGWQAKQPA